MGRDTLKPDILYEKGYLVVGYMRRDIGAEIPVI